MHGQTLPTGTIRKLWPTETAKFRDHLLRLDRDSRRMRFAHGVSDRFIEDYAARMADTGGIVYGYFEGEDVRAVAELKKLGDTWGREAEAAFSVELLFAARGGRRGSLRLHDGGSRPAQSRRQSGVTRAPKRTPIRARCVACEHCLDFAKCEPRVCSRRRSAFETRQK